jgi:hypothetical protein
LLSDDEIKAYKRDGYVVPNYRLSPEVLAHLQQMCVNLMVDNPTVTGVPLTHMHAPGYSGQNLVQRDDWFAACTMPDILDMVEQLHGPDIVLWSSAVFHKEAFKGGRVNYHRDSLHFPIEPCISPNVWIAVTPSTIENGCVRMVKGSHLEGKAGEHELLAEDESSDDVVVAIRIKNAEAYEAHATPVELEAGQMYIADVHTIHGGGPNKSPNPRTGFSIRYYPATSRYVEENAPKEHSGEAYTHFDNRPLFLVRGTDRAGNDFSIGHAVPNGGLPPFPKG